MHRSFSLNVVVATLVAMMMTLNPGPTRAQSLSEGAWSADCGADGCAMRTQSAQGDLLFLIGLKQDALFSAGIRFASPVADFSEAITLSTGGGYTTFLPQDDYALFAPASDLYLTEPAKTARIVEQFERAANLTVNFVNSSSGASSGANSETISSTEQSGERQFSLNGFSAVLAAVRQELGITADRLVFAAPPGLERAAMPAASHHTSQGATPGSTPSAPAPQGIPAGGVRNARAAYRTAKGLSGGTLRGVAPTIQPA
jgi:hypothetical protein